LREVQRGIADEIEALREAMAKEEERANSADVECMQLTGMSCPCIAARLGCRAYDKAQHQVLSCVLRGLLTRCNTPFMGADKMQLLSEDKAKVQVELQDCKRKMENMTIALEEASIIESKQPVDMLA
jgi:hypothetical protein